MFGRNAKPGYEPLGLTMSSGERDSALEKANEDLAKHQVNLRDARVIVSQSHLDENACNREISELEKQLEVAKKRFMSVRIATADRVQIVHDIQKVTIPGILNRIGGLVAGASTHLSITNSEES